MPYIVTICDREGCERHAPHKTWESAPTGWIMIYADDHNGKYCSWACVTIIASERGRLEVPR